MSDATVIRTEGLGKRYHIRQRRAEPSRLPWRRTEAADHWAVRDLDLEVAAGEILGLIGPNGAGKSTLLQLLARTTHPSEGQFSIAGRVASMLEVGVGFSWELSGRENIYLSGTLMGMRRHEVRARMDEIIEFSGISSYIDVPVKRYSSGMYVRLGFAVAAHLIADVMLVDEVLSVGDAAFRARCQAKMQDAARDGRTIVYVSHGLGSVQEFCDRAVLLEHGRLAGDGAPADVIRQYLHARPSPTFEAPDVDGSQVRAVQVAAGARDDTGAYAGTDALTVSIGYELTDAQPGCRLVVAVAAADGPPLFTSTSEEAGFALPDMPGQHEVRMTIPPGRLADGDYHVALALFDGHGYPLWTSDATATFSVTGGVTPIEDFPAGSSRLHLPCAWS